MNDSRELFQRLMQVGDIGQEKVIAHFEAQGYITLGLNHDVRYDVQMLDPDGEDCLLEIKTDCTASPNIAIEVWSRNKPSGIYATQAHKYCVYYTQTGELWVFDVPRLKAEISDLMGLKTVPVKAIQGTNTWVRLLPKQLARKYNIGEVLNLKAESHVTGISVLNQPALNQPALTAADKQTLRAQAFFA